MTSDVGLAQLLTTLPARPAGPQFRCTPPSPVDMIFLVDGSWSIGHSHFQQVKDFLASVIEPFEIGPSKVQVGGYLRPALRPCPRCPHEPSQRPGGPTLRTGLLGSPGGGVPTGCWDSRPGDARLTSPVQACVLPGVRGARLSSQPRPSQA